MIIITNRNIQNSKPPEERFGKKFNSKGPDELRLAKAYRKNGNWQVDVCDDVSYDDKGNKIYASERCFLELQENMRTKKRNCLFFVHGFNNDFRDVLERCEKLEKEYQVEVIAFTWPANGRGATLGRVGGVASYKSDKRDAIRSATALDRVLERLNVYLNKYSDQTMICGQSMTLMLHSMGNYLFKNLLKSSVYQGESALFDNIVMACADVNNKKHKEWVERIAFRKRLYITINENDSALKVSRMKFGEKQLARLGHYSLNLTAENAIYLDFTNAKHVDSSHAYFEGEPVHKNASVKQTFDTILNGGKIEQILNYNNRTQAFEI